MLQVSVASARIAPHQEMDAATLALGFPHLVVGLRGLVGELRIGELRKPEPMESSIPQALLCCVLVGIVLL